VDYLTLRCSFRKQFLITRSYAFLCGCRRLRGLFLISFAYFWARRAAVTSSWSWHSSRIRCAFCVGCRCPHGGLDSARFSEAAAGPARGACLRCPPDAPRCPGLPGRLMSAISKISSFAYMGTVGVVGSPLGAGWLTEESEIILLPAILLFLLKERTKEPSYFTSSQHMYIHYSRRCVAEVKSPIFIIPVLVVWANRCVSISCLKHSTDCLLFQLWRTFHEAHKQRKAHRHNRHIRVIPLKPLCSTIWVTVRASLAFWIEYFLHLPNKL